MNPFSHSTSAQALDPERAAAVTHMDSPVPVLLLHSYHKGMYWADSITDGFERVLYGAHPDADLHVEYLDTKRNNEDNYLDNLAAAMKCKFAGKNFRVVVTADDNALRFALAHRQSVFNSAPIVFCGVNFYDPAEFKGIENLTGVVEDLDIRGTLEIAMRMHPGTGNIYIINDRTPTGVANRRLLQKVLSELPAVPPVHFLEDYTMEGLTAKLATLSPDSVVVLFSFNRDRSGRVFRYRHSIAQISRACPVPIYGVWAFYVGRGAVGGSCTSGEIQGARAAEAATRIIAGTPPESIPVVTRCPEQAMFDYRQLVRFNLEKMPLPPGSIVLNRPTNHLAGYWGVIAGTVSIIAVLGFFVVSLSMALISRRRAERERETLVKALEEKKEELEGIIFVTSHDLKSPMMSVIGFTSELRKAVDEIAGIVPLISPIEAREDISAILKGKAAKGLEYIGRGIARMDSIILGISRLAKLGAANLAIEEIDVERLVDEALGSLRFQIERLGVEVLRGDLPSCLGDRTLLGHAFSNLLENAVKYSECAERPHRVEIRGYIQEGDAVYEVIDNGPGIPPERARKVFELFYRLKRNDSICGDGLGLSLVKRIAERHGGAVSVESDGSSGSKFTLRIPCHRLQADGK